MRRWAGRRRRGRTGEAEGKKKGGEEEEEEEEEEDHEVRANNQQERKQHGPAEKTRLAVPGLDPGTSGIFSAARSSLETE